MLPAKRTDETQSRGERPPVTVYNAPLANPDRKQSFLRFKPSVQLRRDITQAGFAAAFFGVLYRQKILIPTI
jgi:hypothetical protein